MVEMSKWGKDHWSTYAYLETIQVDRKGIVDRLKMRCDPDVHPHLAVRHSSGRYPTLIKTGKLPAHDDWSCMEDMVLAGLLIVTWVTGTMAKVEFTDMGWAIAGMLRRHRAEGGKYANFEPVWVQP